MSKTLYEEALDAAEQIRNAAEEKVKQRLVESMAPRIKEMVESSFTKESSQEDCSEDEIIDEEDVEECNESEENDSKPEEGDEENDDTEQSDDPKLSETAKRIFSKLINSNNKKLAVESKINDLRERTRSLKKAILMTESQKYNKSIDDKIVSIYKNLLKETKNIKFNSIIKNDNTLLKEYLEISKELKNMSRRRRTKSGFLNESLEDLLETNLFEEDDDEMSEEEEESADEKSDDKEFDLDLEDEGDEEEDLSAPVAEGGKLEDLVRRFIDDAEPMLGGGGSAEDELELDLDDDEEGEDEMEESYLRGESDDIDEMYELDELEEEELEESRRRRRGERVFEIDENMLRREVQRMKRIREGEAKDMASHFGGGSLGKEMFVDVDEGDLNVHAGHLGREGVPTPKVESALRNAARKNRMLESKMSQYKKALRGMKNQLSEMNLFNAKLLYANKLMQNRDLSIKQQRHIVESLDDAKTLNEAKILFESLSKTLVKSTSRSGNTMNESVNRNTAGYSSRPVSSAQPMNEGVALDRWATLAGLKR